MIFNTTRARRMDMRDPKAPIVVGALLAAIALCPPVLAGQSGDSHDRILVEVGTDGIERITWAFPDLAEIPPRLLTWGGDGESVRIDAHPDTPARLVHQIQQEAVAHGLRYFAFAPYGPSMRTPLRVDPSGTVTVTVVRGEGESLIHELEAELRATLPSRVVLFQVQGDVPARQFFSDLEALKVLGASYVRWEREG